MGPHTLENETISINLVDENPVGFDMAFTSTNIISDEFVIPMDRVQWLSRQQCPRAHLELLAILAASPAPLHVF